MQSVENKMCENDAAYLIPTKVVADIVGTTMDNVVKVRKGLRGKSGNGKAGTIRFTDRYLAEAMGIAIVNVREIIGKEIPGAE